MMMRWIFAFFLIAVGIYLIRFNSLRNLAVRRLAFVFFVGLGLASLVFKDSWTKISQYLGVESGTALLTYVVTFAFIFYVIASFKWRRDLEQKITLLARDAALNRIKKDNEI